jgi:hypothetical protein
MSISTPVFVTAFRMKTLAKYRTAFITYNKLNKMNNFPKLSSNLPETNFSIKKRLVQFMRFLAGNDQIPYSNGEITLFYLTTISVLICLLLLFFFI